MRRDESGVLGVSMAFSAGHAEENSQWMCCFERNRQSVKTWLFCTAEPVELKDEARLYLHNTEMCQAFFSPLLSNVSSGFHSTNHSRLLELLN